ncbi:MAG: MogA/MoaB family molybdenum cofactor biosynthesis protein [Pontiella sp.]
MSEVKVAIITLSDRAFAGEYDDLSGPEIEKLVSAGLEAKDLNPVFDRILIPDDGDQLEQQVIQAQENGMDVLFTTGGTGIGPRDITPDVVIPLLDREIPGIMEFIRVKHGERLPSALLSRSVAGTIGDMLIYTLPGSVKAVREYTEEILRSLPHSLLMVKGIDAH